MTTRDVYDRSLRAATRLLDGESDLSVFSVWTLGFLRGMTVREHRHIALDAMLAALDEHEDRRAPLDAMRAALREDGS